LQNGNDPSIRGNEFVVYYSWILYCGMCLGIHGYYIGEMTLSLFRTGITIISNERMSVGLLADARTIELFIEKKLELEKKLYAVMEGKMRYRVDRAKYGCYSDGDYEANGRCGYEIIVN